MTTWQLDIHTGVNVGKMTLTRIEMHDIELDELDLDELFEICNSQWDTASSLDSWQARVYRQWERGTAPSMSIGDFVVASDGAPVKKMALLTSWGWKFGTYTVVGGA